jgi:hypothetical protein
VTGDQRYVLAGRQVTFLHYGKEKSGTIERLSSDGSIVFLTSGRWMHRASVTLIEEGEG